MVAPCDESEVCNRPPKNNTPVRGSARHAGRSAVCKADPVLLPLLACHTCALLSTPRACLPSEDSAPCLEAKACKRKLSFPPNASRSDAKSRRLFRAGDGPKCDAHQHASEAGLQRRRSALLHCMFQVRNVKCVRFQVECIAASCRKLPCWNSTDQLGTVQYGSPARRLKQHHTGISTASQSKALLWNQHFAAILSGTWTV